MCARYSLSAPSGDLERLLDADIPEGIQPRYNIAPTQTTLAVVMHDGEREARFLKWGLVPSWAESPAVGHRLINARAETAADRPSFRTAFRKRRCLIPATAFFEWRHLDRADSAADDERRDMVDQPSLIGLGIRSRSAARKPSKKRPYLFQLREGQPFAFAGLWERWHGPDGRELETCTVLTTLPNGLVAPLHDRMPCILGPNDFARWLDPQVEDPREFRDLLAPFPEEEMRSWPVSPALNNVRNEGPELVQPVAVAL